MTLRRIHIMLDERELAAIERLWPGANRSEIIRAIVSYEIERQLRNAPRDE